MIDDTIGPFHYRVYGIHLETDRLVPGLVPISCPGDTALKIYFQRLPEWFHLICQSWSVIHSSKDRNKHGAPLLIVSELSVRNCYLFSYDDGSKFLVDQESRNVWCTWPDNLTLEDAAIYLLGPVLAFAVRLTGITCLHASAFVFENSAITLVGGAGSGKSTTAAALAQRGFPILSDDVVALSYGRETIQVEPGYPCLRLWPDSVNALFGSEEALARLTPNWGKCYLDLSEQPYRFPKEPLPLAAIYLLSDRTDDATVPNVETMPSSQALLSLIVNSYASCLLNRFMREREFKCLTRVLKCVPIRRVRPHREPACLPKLCDVILEDLDAMRPSFLARTEELAGRV